MPIYANTSVTIAQSINTSHTTLLRTEIVYIQGSGSATSRVTCESSIIERQLDVNELVPHS